MSRLGAIVDVVRDAHEDYEEATPENIAARKRWGQIRTVLAAALPIAALVGGYRYAARRARR